MTEKLTDGEINEITGEVLGVWPSFEAQSWACKVVHAVAEAQAGPPDLTSPDVAALCERLSLIRTGLEALGVSPFVLDHAVAKLRALDQKARHYENSEEYQAGHKAGWEAAFATGLVEEIRAEADKLRTEGDNLVCLNPDHNDKCSGEHFSCNPNN